MVAGSVKYQQGAALPLFSQTASHAKPQLCSMAANIGILTNKIVKCLLSRRRQTEYPRSDMLSLPDHLQIRDILIKKVVPFTDHKDAI